MGLVPKVGQRYYRWRRAGFRIGLILVASLATLYLFRGPLLARSLGEVVAHTLSQRIGGTFQAEAVKGGWFSDAVVFHVRMVTPPAGGPLTDLSFDRLEVTYGLFDLFRHQPLAGIHSLRINGLRLGLDLTKTTSGASRQVPSKRFGLDDLPNRLPAVEVHGALTIKFPFLKDHSATLDVAAFSIVSSGNTTKLTCEGIASPEINLMQSYYSARISRQAPGEFVFDSDDSVAGWSIHKAMLTSESGSIKAVIATSVGGGDMITVIRPGSYGLHGAGVDLSRLPAWMYRLTKWPNSGVWNIDASAQHSKSLWNGALRAEVKGLKVHGILIQNASLEASLADGQVFIKSLHAESDGSILSISDLGWDQTMHRVSRIPSHLDLDIMDLRPIGHAIELGRYASVLPDVLVSLHVHVLGSENGGARLNVALTCRGSSVTAIGSVREPPDGVLSHAELAIAWYGTVDLRDFSGLDRDWSGVVSTHGDFNGSFALPILHVELNGYSIQRGGRPKIDVTIQGGLHGSLVTVDRASVVQQTDHVEMAGSFDLRHRQFTGVHIDASLQNIGSLCQWNTQCPKISGSMQADLRYDGPIPDREIERLRSVNADMQLTVNSLVIGNRPVGDLTFEGEVHAARAHVSQFSVNGAVQVTAAGDVLLEESNHYQGVLTRLDAKLADKPQVFFSLQGESRIDYRPGIGPKSAWSVGPTVCTFCGGRLTGHVTVGESIDVRIHAIRISPWKLMKTAYLRPQGQVDLVLTANGSPDHPEAHLIVQTVGGRILDHPAECSIEANQDVTGLHLSRCDAFVGKTFTMTSSGTWPLVVGSSGFHRVEGAGEFRLSSFLTMIPGFIPDDLGIPESGCAQIELRILPLSAEFNVRARDVLIHIPPPDQSSKAVPDAIAKADIRVRGDPTGWQASVAIADTASLQISGKASGSAPFDSTRISDFWTTLLQDDINGEVSLQQMELAPLVGMLPVLVRLSGSVTGALRLSGHPSMPRWNGDLAVNELSLKAKSDIPALTDGQARLRLEGTRVTIDRLNARLGYADVTATGSVDLGNFQPAFDISVLGKNVLLIRNQYLRLRTDCDLHLNGPIEGMKLYGSIHVTDALWSRPIELLSRIRPTGGHRAKEDGVRLFSLREAPLSTMSFDVEVHSEQSLHVRNNVFRGDCSMDLHLTGTGESPLPQGRIWCEEASLRMPFTTIQIAQAAILFSGDDPFVPRLDGDGEARLKGYDLRVHASGHLPDIEVSVESDPPLSTNEGVMLLTTGLTGHEREEQGAQRTELTMVGKYFAKEIWHQVSGPGDPDRKQGLLDLDRLDISIGQELSRSGQETIDAEYELSRRYYLHGERDRFDDYDLGLIWRIHRR